jgi:hypothetical protein
MFLLSALVHVLPPEGQGESLRRVILSPLLLVARCLMRLVDIMGPAGLAEPASHYLAW